MQLVRNDFIKLLEQLMPGLAIRAVAENTGSFIFDKHRIYTYNDAIGVSVPFKISFHCAVPALPLYRFLKKLPDEQVSLSMLDTGELMVKGKKGKAKLKVIDGVKLPFDERVEKAETIATIEKSGNFAKGLKFCLFTVSRNAQNPETGCVHVGNDNRGTYCESTDSTRLTRYYFTKHTLPINILVPLEAAQALVNYKVVGIAQAEGWLVFKCEGDVVFATWTTSFAFPDLMKYIKGFSEPVASINLPDNLIEVLERAEILAETETKVDQDEFITFTLGNGRMVVSSSGVYGRYSEKIKIDYTGETVSFAVPPLFVRDLMRLTSEVHLLEGIIKCSGKRFWHYAGLIENDSISEEGDEDE